MNHFPDEAWLDFVRRVMPQNRESLIREHLDDGCKDCLRLCQLWSAIVSMIGRESAYRPPESAVRLAKAAFAETKLLRSVPRPVRMALLVFDSFGQPVPAGLRTSVVPVRQTLHESGSFLVDLRVEPDTARNRVFLAGQILNSRTPNEAVKTVEVVLQLEAKIGAKALASPLGEFHLEFSPEQNLRLLVAVPGHRAIGIALPGPEKSLSGRRAKVN